MFGFGGLRSASLSRGCESLGVAHLRFDGLGCAKPVLHVTAVLCEMPLGLWFRHDALIWRDFCVVLCEKSEDCAKIVVDFLVAFQLAVPRGTFFRRLWSQILLVCFPSNLSLA